MKLTTRILLLIISPFLPGVIFAQTKTSGYNKSDYYSNFTPEGPQAAGLGSFGNTPINYYTRLPEISVPLMTLSSRDLSIPISLNYDASGMRQDDISGPVGMKWNLDAGGYVVRQMNGLPDEDPNNGYWKYKTELNAATVDLNTWGDAAVKNTRDTEPDEFAISISGRSIQFYLKDNYTVTTVPYQNVIILPTRVDGKLTKFDLITEDGIKYTFGGTPSTIEERKVETLNAWFNFNYYYKDDTHTYRVDNWGGAGNNTIVVNSFFSGNPFLYRAQVQERAAQTYNSKWHLVKITSPTNDQISFSYIKETTSSKFATQPTMTRREPLLKNIELGYSYVQNVIVKDNGFPISDDYADVTFTHTDWKTPAFAKYTDACPDYIPNCTNGYGVDVPKTATSVFFDPRDYNFVNDYPDGVTCSQSLVTESVIKLSQITTSAGNKVTFTTSGREDFPNSFKYDNISLSSFNGGLVKSIKLDYSTIETTQLDNMWFLEGMLASRITNPAGVYTGPLVLVGTNYLIYANHIQQSSESSINRADNSDNPSALNNALKKYTYEGLKSYNFKRLFLNSIKEVSGGSEQLISSFLYNQNFRRRLTPNQNAMGGNLATQSPYENYNVSLNNTGNIYAQIVSPLNPAANRGGNEIGISGILYRITYPTGGFTSLTYDLGPNLSKISDYTGASTLLSVKEIVPFTFDSFNGGSVVLTSYENNQVPNTSNYKKFRVTTSYNQNRESPFSHGVIGAVKKVRVYSGLATNHNGYEDFVFRSAANDNNLIYASPKDKDVSGNEIDYLTVEAFPFPRKLVKDHLRGQLEEHYVYDKNNNLMLFQKNEYTVNPNGFVPSTLKAYTAGSYAYGSSTKYRYARSSISGDWLALTKKTERIYHQQYPGDIGKSSTKITELTYNNYNQAVSQAVIYNEANPSVKNITKTTYPFQYGYEEVNCGDVVGPCNPTPPASQEVAAMQLLTSQNQLSIPVEVQNLVEENGTTRLTSATAYLFRTVGTNPIFVKPSTVMGLSSILETTGTGPNVYQEFSVSPSSGTVITDPHMQILHNYDSYNATGNIVQQTTKDGITSSYGWDATNTLVNSSSIGTGSLQQTTTYQHTPGVGLISTTDPNGIKASFEYGRFNRLKLTRDKDNNILTRYRYNYAGDAELANSITVTGSMVTGQAIYFGSPDNVEFGQTQYEWNFGDGTKITNSGGLNHNYSTAGTYTVTLNKTNPEYSPVTLTKTIVINRQGEVNLTMSGSSYIDNCQYDANFSQPVLGASLSYGCPGNLSYYWEYRRDNGNWNYFGNAAQVGPPPGFSFCGAVGYYEVQCTITDGCGNAVVSGPNSIGLTVVQYNCSNCSMN